MFYARYRTKRVLVKPGVTAANTLTNITQDDIMDERWIAIDASKEKIAKERAHDLRPPHDRYMPEDAEVQIDIFDERDMLDLRIDRAFLLERLKEAEPAARETALAETLNLLRETLHDAAKRMTVKDPAGNVVQVMRISDLFSALDSGPSGTSYLTTADGDFEKERNKIVMDLFAGIGKNVGKKAAGTGKPTTKKTTSKSTRPKLNKAWVKKKLDSSKKLGSDDGPIPGRQAVKPVKKQK